MNTSMFHVLFSEYIQWSHSGSLCFWFFLKAHQHHFSIVSVDIKQRWMLLPTSSHTAKVKAKYSKYEQRRLALVMSIGTRTCTVQTGQWLRYLDLAYKPVWLHFYSIKKISPNLSEKGTLENQSDKKLFEMTLLGSSDVSHLYVDFNYLINIQITAITKKRLFGHHLCTQTTNKLL